MFRNGVLIYCKVGFFNDYSSNFYETPITWFIVGVCITIGTILSVIPQILIIIQKKSSFGLNSITTTFTSIGQILLVVNVLCFNSNIFIGFFQFRFSKIFPVFLTFINMLSLWFCYLFIVYLNVIFQKKKKTTTNKAAKEKNIFYTMYDYFDIILFILCISLSIFLFLLFVIIGTKHGFASREVKSYGTWLGSIASVLVYAQYLPQIFTTCRLKSSGSLSLLMLGIQAPGGLLNSLFMWIGQGQHWSTWISVMLAAVQQFILLSICLYYKNTKNNNNNIINNDDNKGKVNNTNAESEYKEIKNKSYEDVETTDGELPDNFILPIIEAI